MTEVYLVDIQLDNLLFAQAGFNLERQQHLVELAGQRFFLGQEKIARHLHGNRRRALLDPTRGEVGQRCPRNPQVIDAAVLEKAFVFGGNNGVNQRLRHLLEFDDRAPFFAKFTDQLAVRAVDPERDFGPIIRQYFERW